MKVTRTIDGQVIYTPDIDDKPEPPPFKESPPECAAPTGDCMCLETKGRPNPFCPFYRKTHVQEIPKGVVIA